ncbi:superoxide dismutase [Ni] [Desulfococcus sp.]|jgi:nickel superoxide dismutase|uniref:superoxide dismutase [Ni] n=1 Tax=Desulfococcus sp. TaxID=2025834 RepID=UPI003D127879
MNRKFTAVSFILTVILWTAGVVMPYGAWAHCEIPCGIYDDGARIQMMLEDATTIEKSMQQATELSGKTPVNYNQLVRWINNKELHADKIQHTTAQYFMTQRIALDAKDYDKKLAALHQILVYAMKCKQTMDLENVAKLRGAIKTFSDLYLGHTHEKE